MPNYMFTDKLSTLFSQAFFRLGRMPGYTLLNMLGLVISLSGTVIITRYLHQEWTIDSWMPERDRICMTQKAEYENEGQQNPSLFAAQKQMEGCQPITEMDGVEAATEVFLRSLLTVKLVDNETFTVNAISADSDFVRVFPLQAVEGTLDLRAAGNAIISQGLARKLFPGESAVGQTFTADNVLHTVTGVFRKPDTKSTLHYEMVNNSANSAWFNNSISFLFTKLRDGWTIEQFNGQQVKQKGLSFYKKKEILFCYQLSPFTVLEHYANDEKWPSLSKHSSPSHLWMLFAVGVLLFLVGVFNFLNLYAVMRRTRDHEMKVRRIFGASKWNIFSMLYMENLLISAPAMLGVWMIIELTTPHMKDWFAIEQMTMPVFDTVLSLSIMFILPLLATVRRPNPSRQGGEPSGLRKVNKAQPLPSLTGGAGGGSSLHAQNSKKVQALKAQKVELQKSLDKSKAQLNVTRQKVQTGQRDLHFIGVQMDNRLDYIKRLEGEMNLLDDQIVDLQNEITAVDGELQAKRGKLRQALRYAQHQKAQQSALLFVLSAKTLTQMYRRARLAREYAAYQQQLGKQIMQKQADLLDAQNRLLEAKSQQTELLREVIGQRRQLSAQQVEQRKKVDGLKKQETGLQGQVAQQQKQLAALDKKIDELIAYEIEQARKRAEEAARKKAAEEAARKAKAAKSSKGSKGSSGSKGSASGSKGSTDAKGSKGSAEAKASSGGGNWLTAEDRQLSGSFEKNKGKLPVPITGPYMLGNRFGLYTVPGLKNVQLDNKGVNYIGRSGARARSIFDGEVTAVFQFSGTRNVLVRHGSYISVYCNLSSVIVKKGQKVKARDVLGTVVQDEKSNCVLHFQLRKETAKLNPEAWIGK